VAKPPTKVRGQHKRREEVHMSNGLKRAEQYRDLAKRYIRLAAMSSSTENRNHYLRIAEHYSTLAEAEDLRTLGHVNGD